MPPDAAACPECGFNRATNTATATVSATETMVKDGTTVSFRSWRTHWTRNPMWLLVPCMLLLIGVTGLVTGILELRVGDGSSETPESISLQKLVQRGAEGNPNIILTDFQFCRKMAIKEDDMGAGWMSIWAPIIVPNEAAPGEDQPAVLGGDIHAILFSTGLRGDWDLPKFDHPQLRAMVTNRISRLGPKESEILQEAYPGIHLEQCLEPVSKPS